MKDRNRARTENVIRVQWLRKDKVKRYQGGNARRRDAGDFLEADAFVAQFRMGELLLRRRFLAQVGNRMRKSRLLCK